jgi:hypothetical protein
VQRPDSLSPHNFASLEPSDSLGDSPMPRHHFHCEACEGTWFAEAEVAETADCPFCRSRDVFAYRSDDGPADAAAIAKRLAATMRKAVARPTRQTERRVKRAS